MHSVCPFCGSGDVGPCYCDDGSVAVRCGTCEAVGPVMRPDCEDAAFAAWNIVSDNCKGVKP